MRFSKFPFCVSVGIVFFNANTPKFPLCWTQDPICYYSWSRPSMTRMTRRCLIFWINFHDGFQFGTYLRFFFFSALGGFEWYVCFISAYRWLILTLLNQLLLFKCYGSTRRRLLWAFEENKVWVGSQDRQGVGLCRPPSNCASVSCLHWFQTSSNDRHEG